MKIQHILFSALMAICLAACEKEGEKIIKPILKSQPFSISGFALVDTLEQYFDGKKVREFAGRANYSGNIVFQKEAPILMELKKKGDSKVLLSKTITPGMADADKTIVFYYEGKDIEAKYNYPAPIADIEQVAFYLDNPANVPVDVVYGDASGDINAVQYLARNVQPGKWSNFIQIPPLNGNGQDLYVFLLKAGKKEWLVNNNFELSYLQTNLPIIGGWYQGGGVQAMYIPFNKKGEIAMTYDLVQLYP